MALEDRLHAALSLYMNAPAFVRRVAGTAWRAVPERLRYGRHYPQHLATAAARPGWSELERRLELTLGALARTPAYAEHRALLAGRGSAWERLAQLPPVSKPDIKRRLDDHVAEGTHKQQRLPMFTGGSTEHPMRFYLQRGVSRPKESAYIRHVESHAMGAGHLRDAWTLSLRGRTVRAAAAAAATTSARDALWTAEPIKRHLLFSSDHLEPRYMPAYVGALRRLRPPLVHAFPSALQPLARWLESHPCPEFTDHVTAVLLTSETVYGFQMALFRRVFPRARIVRHYGHSERVLMAVAGDDAPYRFYPLYGYPELLDAQGRAVTEPGVVGEIAGTGFDNLVMPFVRYRTGDLGVWRQVPRPGHGEPVFEMERIDGRLQEFVVCRDDRLVSVTTLGAAHFSELAEVDAIQFEQREAGRVTLRVAAPGGLDAGRRERIARAVVDKTQGGCEVDIDIVERIERTPRGKHRMLLQHIDLRHRFGMPATPAQVAPCN